MILLQIVPKLKLIRQHSIQSSDYMVNLYIHHLFYQTLGLGLLRLMLNQDTARTTSCLVGTMSNFYWTGAVEDYSLSIVSTSSLNINGGTPPYAINWYGKDTNALNAGFHKSGFFHGNLFHDSFCSFSLSGDVGRVGGLIFGKRSGSVFQKAGLWIYRGFLNVG